LLVLLIFGVMLTSKSPKPGSIPRGGNSVALGLRGDAQCLGHGAAQFVVHGRRRGAGSIGGGPRSKTADHLFNSFEVAGVLLFIVMVGAALAAGGITPSRVFSPRDVASLVVFEG
jgi:hypothetical protein